MKLSSVTIASIAAGLSSVQAFAPMSNTAVRVRTSSTTTTIMGYLDELNGGEVAPPPSQEVEEDDSREATAMKKDDVDRGGVGNWDSYVEFNEFDGGDGQMGVAGDGDASLEKFDMTQMAKSKTMSAKNAWGKSTGYADTLVEKGVDTARAQQLENWHNQQEVLQQRKNQRFMTDDFDKPTSSDDDNWRNLASFGVERNQDFDLDETFGAVEADVKLEGTIELTGRMNGPYATHEFSLRNPFMGFADFRAAFTSDTPDVFTIEPTEGALRQKEDTEFLLKFKAQSPGVAEGYLVIETEDFKKTWKIVGSTN